MKNKELQKTSDAIRRKISRDFGFKQSGYINWIIKDDYFFCLMHLSRANVYLNVKPVYADDLWWDIFEIPENKKCPTSLRGNGAFSVQAIQINKYSFLTEDTEIHTEDELREKWKDIFNMVMHDMESFSRKYPDANTFIPNKEIDRDPDRLLFFISLLHNERNDEVVKRITELKQKGHSCLFHNWASNMDSYDYILKWCLNK